MTRRFILETPSHFNFRSALTAHGWSALMPFVLDTEKARLDYVFGYERPLAVSIYVGDDRLTVDASRDVEESNAARLIADVRHILRIDDDLEKFYKLAARHKRLKGVAENDGGRLLRSATVFEDLVKTLCTTNCSWALTKIMVANLVAKLGAEDADGNRAFPTADAMARMNEDFYRNEIRVGYRAPFFVELANRVASGELDPESWLKSELPTAELKKEMKKVKGCGDYAAENLLKLVGRYDGLALDSWLRGNFYKTHNRDEKCDDKQIAAHYEKFGEWKGLAIWCDMAAS